MPLTSDDAEVYSAFPPYFEAIQYWRDPDSGAWEEGRKVNNSSVGAVVAGLEELLRYLACAGAGTIGDIPSLCEVNTDNLRALIAKGRQRLVDSALLFLIHPLRVLRPRPVQDAVLNLVQARLKGDVGIKRYGGDSYFCQDYDEWFPPEERSSDFSERLDFRDAHLQPNCEAQWCIFDPLLSII